MQPTRWREILTPGYHSNDSATGREYCLGQPAAAIQSAQGTSPVGNMFQSATRAPGPQEQNSQPTRWRQILTPGSHSNNSETGGIYGLGQPTVAIQSAHVQGTSPAGNTLQSATSAPGQQVQHSRPIRWRQIVTPGNPPGNAQGGVGAITGTHGVSV